MRLHFKLIVLFLSVAFAGKAQIEKNKTALLIGVGDYAKSTGWQPLHSKNDIELIKGTLLKKGFAESDIFTLTNAEATHTGIKKAIEHFNQKVTIGGVAYFHFSGHGQQAADDNGEEIDGLDEALVPYNSPKIFDKKTNRGDSLIRDDFLEKQFLKIRKKLGANGHLLVTIDACHSGTTMRGLTIGRGTDVIMGSDDFVLNKEVENSFFKSEKNQETAEELAPTVSVFSSSANQLSYEIQANEKEYGVFTHAFCEAILNAKNDATYESVFSKIKRSVALKTRRQTPQIEGPENALLFNGTLRTIPTHYPVREMITNDLVLLGVGSLAGLQVGSEVVFFPKETSDTVGQQPLAEGIIDIVTPFDADVRLSQLSKVDLNTARAFVRKKNFGSLALNLKLTIGSASEESALKNALSSYPFFKFSNQKPDLFLDKNQGFAGKEKYQLFAADETLLSEFDAVTDSIPNLAAELAAVTGEYAQSLFLRSLELPSGDLIPTVRLLFQNHEGTFEPLISGIGKEGKTVKLEIKNEGKIGFYFSVIDITPDNKSALIIPFAKPSADFFLSPGGKYLSDEFVIAPPYGSEVLKIIATDEPLQLSRYIRTRSSFKNASNPLEILLSQTFFPGQLRSGQTTSVYVGESSISSFIFEIEK